MFRSAASLFASSGRTSPSGGGNGAGSVGYATFQALDRHAAVASRVQRSLANGASLTNASMHAAVVTRPFAGVNGALRRRVQKLNDPSPMPQNRPPTQVASNDPNPLSENQQKPVDFGYSPPSTAMSDPYDLRAKALLEVEVDYRDTGKTQVPLHVLMQRLYSASSSTTRNAAAAASSPLRASVPPVAVPLVLSARGDGDVDDVGSCGAPSYRDIPLEDLAEAITVTGTSNGCTIAPPSATTKQTMPSFMARVNRDRVMPPHYASVHDEEQISRLGQKNSNKNADDPILERYPQAPPTPSAPAANDAPTCGISPQPRRLGTAKSSGTARPARGPQLITRSEWTKVVVLPIRPPRYQVPQLPQRPPSDDVIINGRVVPKPHPALQLVRTIQLHKLDDDGQGRSHLPLAPTVVRQQV